MLPQEAEIADEHDESSFEQKMLKRVQADYGNAQEFMRPFQRLCVERHWMYHNASRYNDLRKMNRFPMPFTQEQVDTFIADMMNRLYSNKRPCTLSGVEDSDKEDAVVKQEMLDWQDYKDGIKAKIKLAVKDTALYGICVSQIDFMEDYENRLIGVDHLVPVLNEDGQPLVGSDGNIVFEENINGEQVTVRKVEAQEVPIYIGPTVKRIDPVDLFITRDKNGPVMVRSFHPLKYFKSKPYFIKFEQLQEDINTNDPQNEMAPTGMTDTFAEDKLKHRSFGFVAGKSKNNHEYVEWQDFVNRRALYEYLEDPDKPVDDEQGNPLFSPDEEVVAIIGMVDGTTIVRLEDLPFDTIKSNVIIGMIQPEEDDQIGVSLTDKISPVQKGLDVMMGMTLANFRQVVNAGHVVNNTMLANDAELALNEPGFTLEVNGDVRSAHARIETTVLAPDLYKMMGLFTDLGEGASGIQRQTTGQSDPGVDTAREATLIDAHASLRNASYLESLEGSYIQPMYDVRNQINMQFLDKPYVYGILGERAIDWREASVTEIRTNVDFVCEASIRETNKAIVAQQMLQGLKIAPAVQAAGYPVRMDKLAGAFFEKAFSMSPKQIDEFFPSIRLEKEGVDIDTMMLQALILRLQLQAAIPGLEAGAGGNQAGGGGGGSNPRPKSEEGAQQSAERRNETKIA